jgi:putative Holliday junction resolvase
MKEAGASRKRTLGLDLGAVRCGVAIDDELGRMSHARPFLAAKDRRALIAELGALAEREGVGRFVLGLPLELSGEAGRAAERTRAFAEQLQQASGLPVVLWDERLTTTQASRALSELGVDTRAQRTTVDSVAAALILQAWLDARAAHRARKRNAR